LSAGPEIVKVPKKLLVCVVYNVNQYSLPLKSLLPNAYFKMSNWGNAQCLGQTG